MAKLAIVDMTGLFLGTESVAEIPTPLPPFRVPVPAGCDLQPGEARWDPDARVWVFLRPRPLPPGMYLFPGGKSLIVKGPRT